MGMNLCDKNAPFVPSNESIDDEYDDEYLVEVGKNVIPTNSIEKSDYKPAKSDFEMTIIQ